MVELRLLNFLCFKGSKILASLTKEAAEPRTILKKKEKHLQKRDAFLQRTEEGIFIPDYSAHNFEFLGLEKLQSPHSKSHNRRNKRKAKEQIAGGLTDIQVVIAELDEDTQFPSTIAEKSSDKTDTGSQSKSSNFGKIGEGKNTTLSKSQRKRTL